MKKISIAQRYKPFSHAPGASCLLPGTALVVQAFPALLRVKGVFEFPLNHHGPVREFTLQQDLEKGCVFVSGIAKEGRFRFCLRAEKEYIDLNGKKFPYAASLLAPQVPLERLSLGSHRSQDWELMKRRFDLKEIFPIFFHLSQWTPPCEKVDSPMLTLLEEGQWDAFLRAAFSGILTPRFVDEEYQGLVSAGESKGSPEALITLAGKKIRSLFFEQNGASLRFLSVSFFETGRMTDVRVEGVGSLDFEWRKKSLRTMVLRPSCDGSIYLATSNPISSFRVRTSRKEKGFRVKGCEELRLKAGEVTFLDRFQI